MNSQPLGALCSPGWSSPAVPFQMEGWRSEGEVAGAQDCRGGRRQGWGKPVSPRSLEPGSHWCPPPPLVQPGCGPAGRVGTFGAAAQIGWCELLTCTKGDPFAPLGDVH